MESNPAKRSEVRSLTTVRFRPVRDTADPRPIPDWFLHVPWCHCHVLSTTFVASNTNSTSRRYLQYLNKHEVLHVTYMYNKRVGLRKIIHACDDVFNVAARLKANNTNNLGLPIKALVAVINVPSWFALHSTFTRQYAVGFVVCGSVLTMTMVDHGGN